MALWRLLFRGRILPLLVTFPCRAVWISKQGLVTIQGGARRTQDSSLAACWKSSTRHTGSGQQRQAPERLRSNLSLKEPPFRIQCVSSLCYYILCSFLKLRTSFVHVLEFQYRAPTDFQTRKIWENCALLKHRRSRRLSVAGGLPDVCAGGYCFHSKSRKGQQRTAGTG